MRTNPIHILLCLLLVLLISCSPKKISSKYYFKNEQVLNQVEKNYRELNKQTPFTIVFSNKNFDIFSIGIKTDTLTYIYEFAVNETRFTDTLTKFHLNAPKITELVQQMQLIKCIWINNFDYYVDEKKNSLTFMSIKPVALQSPFSNKKYYILTYFKAPQYFDNEGRLLDKRKSRKLRKINGEIFKRINDKVCYTISGRYR